MAVRGSTFNHSPLTRCYEEMNGTYDGESQIRSSSGRRGGAQYDTCSDMALAAQISIVLIRLGCKECDYMRGRGSQGERLGTFAGGDDGCHATHMRR